MLDILTGLKQHLVKHLTTMFTDSLRACWQLLFLSLHIVLCNFTCYYQEHEHKNRSKPHPLAYTQLDLGKKQRHTERLQDYTVRLPHNRRCQGHMTAGSRRPRLRCSLRSKSQCHMTRWRRDRSCCLKRQKKMNSKNMNPSG